MLKLIVFLCLSIRLFAEVEYDIVLLAPKGEELIDASIETWYHKPLNEAGYAWKPGVSGNDSLFIYHQNLGFKILPIPRDLENARIATVNNQGIAVGTTRKYNDFRIEEKIFVYHAKSDEYFDLFDHFGVSGIQDYSIEAFEITNLTITDNNEIIFLTENDSKYYIYNLEAIPLVNENLDAI